VSEGWPPAGGAGMPKGGGRGLRSGRASTKMAFEFPILMGLGHERFDVDLQAWASDYRYSESNHRRFYQRWAQLMTAGSWAEDATASSVQGGG
jgi:hypothetical protein